MKKIALIALLAATGCDRKIGPVGPWEKYTASVGVREVNLKDGTRCALAVNGFHGVGIDCDWRVNQ